MPLRVGVVGCGNISDIYLSNAPRFGSITMVACADLRPEQAAAKAERYGIESRSVEALINSADIDVVLNLTVPDAHASISLAALEAGKHVYSEKPLATRLADGEAILAAATGRGLRVGCAPDTVLGANVQAARRLVDEGALGRPLIGITALLSHGMENRHPNPAFFFKAGSGPVLDEGPYRIATFVTLLGPVRSVMAMGQIGQATRTITTPGSPLIGEDFPVETETSVQVLLQFEGGAQAVLMLSWDIWKSGMPPLELHGTGGSLRLPDLNWFGGDLTLFRPDGSTEAISTDKMAFGIPNYSAKIGPVANYRGLGLADMAQAILEGRQHRASGEFALHTLAVMDAIISSTASGKRVDIAVSCERPPPLDEAAARQLLA